MWKKILLCALLFSNLSVFAETVMETTISGKPNNSIIYLETGSAAACSQEADSHHWQTGRWYYGLDVLPIQQVIEKDICWDKTKGIITILVLDSHEQITMDESSFKYIKQQKIDYCTRLGMLYAYIADFRSRGASPKTILVNMAYFQNWINARHYGLGGAFWYGILPEMDTVFNSQILYKDFPLSVRKKAINQVFFSRAFENSGGVRLVQDIQRICMHGERTSFTPLK